MIKQYRIVSVAVCVCTALFVLNSCDPIIVKTDKNYIQDSYERTNISLPAKHVEPFPVANVDYDHANCMVFFDFENGKQWSVKNTVWDIAIVVEDPADSGGSSAVYAVTNSGDYGENTRLRPFETGKSEDQYINTLKLKDVQQVCFKNGKTDLSPYQNDPSGKQPVANPFYDALTTEKKYFLRVGKNFDDAKLFVIWFDKITPPVTAGQSFTLHVKPVTLDDTKTVTGFGSEYTLSGTISAEYSFNYIKIELPKDTSTVSARVLTEKNGIPKKNEWQLLFMRTNIYSREMGEVFKNDGIIGTCSILVNSPGGVQTAALYGWDFPEVTAVPADKHFKRSIDEVGHGFANPLKDDPEKRRKAWYFGVNMPPTFYLSRNTYVFKWKSGSTTKYAKFRPGTFYGPHGEKFYVQFRYAYKAGSTD